MGIPTRRPEPARGVRGAGAGAPEAVLGLAGPPEGHPGRRSSTGHAAAGRRLSSCSRRVGDRPWAAHAILSSPIRCGRTSQRRCRPARAGIQTVVVTGDHPTTAATIALGGRARRRRIVTGAELDALDDERSGSGWLSPRRGAGDPGSEAAARPAARRSAGRWRSPATGSTTPRPSTQRTSRSPWAAAPRWPGRPPTWSSGTTRSRPSWTASGGAADRRQRPEGPRLPDLDPRRPARVHPHRHARGVRPAAPADPDPVA